MNKKSSFSKVILLLSAMLTMFIALPVAAVSYDSSLTIDRYNIKGTSFKVGPKFSGNFCYLSKVGIRETDTSKELATCHIKDTGPKNNRVWILEATLGTSSDADVFCSAICYKHHVPRWTSDIISAAP